MKSSAFLCFDTFFRFVIQINAEITVDFSKESLLFSDISSGFH